MLKINKEMPIPLYYQFKQIILEQITSGVYNPGDKIPTELDLIDQYDLSRTTVRQAINELVNEGYLVRQKGIGTTVTSKKNMSDIRYDIKTGIARTGAAVKTKLLNLEVRKANKVDCQFLGITLEDDVYQLDRLRYGDDQPVAFSTTVIPCNLFPNLMEHKEDVTMHLHTYMANQGHKINLSEHYVELGVADKKTAEVLGIRKNNSVLILKDIHYAKDKAVEWSLASIHRSESIILHFITGEDGKITK